MILNKISQGTNSAVVMVRVVFFLFTATEDRAINLSSLLTYETNGPSRNKSHNFGFVSDRKLQLNEIHNEGVTGYIFLICGIKQSDIQPFITFN